MIWWVAVPLILAAGASWRLPRLAPTRNPRAESLVIASLLGSLAGATLVAASAVAMFGVARLAASTGIVGWSARRAATDPVPGALSVGAAVCVLVWATLGVRMVRRDLGDLRRVHRALGSRPFDGVDTVEIAGDAAEAHAVARLGWLGGRIVLTTGLRQLLDDDERAAVVAHERAHLSSHHFALRLVGRLAGVVNPALRPLTGRLDESIERWADADAAHATDPAIVASAIARVALGSSTLPPGALAAGGSRPGVVVERVECLLSVRPGHRRLVVWSIGTLSAAIVVSTVIAGITETYFEHLMH